jgi:hypothetical protein
MILCLKGGKLGKVIDLYFLSFRPINGVENVKFNLIASGDTNLLFPPRSHYSNLYFFKGAIAFEGAIGV